jgi:hypothetical protein
MHVLTFYLFGRFEYYPYVHIFVSKILSISGFEPEILCVLIMLRKLDPSLGGLISVVREKL